jgi:energy-coupling factor transport system ATP-binding protein
VVQYADRVLHVAGDGTVAAMDVRDAMSTLTIAPSVTRLGRALGWSPLPLSLREARRFAETLDVAALRQPNGAREPVDVTVRVEDLVVEYGGTPALDGVSFEARRGEILALMGRNGAGKTTLLRALVGLTKPSAGKATVAGRDVLAVRTEALARDIALVPQAPTSVLYHDTIEAEIADTLAGTRREGSVGQALAEWRLEGLVGAHPGDVSAGERQRAALAAMLVGAPRLILLDEPTRGMDHDTKHLLIENLRRRCVEGATVILASHDVELAGACADWVLLLADGRVVADGLARDVLTETLTFSTQVNKLLGGRFLTPEDVVDSLNGRRR